MVVSIVDGGVVDVFVVVSVVVGGVIVWASMTVR